MKKLLLIAGLIIALSIPLTAYAATSDSSTAQAIRGFCGIDVSDLTDEQKADLETQYNAMMDLKKETIAIMVENGSLTAEEGDIALQNIDDMIKYHEENGFTNGFYGNGCKGSNGRNRGNSGCTYNTTTEQ